jgi:hypothetical protein
MDVTRTPPGLLPDSSRTLPEIQCPSLIPLEAQVLITCLIDYCNLFRSSHPRLRSDVTQRDMLTCLINFYNLFRSSCRFMKTSLREE